MMRLAGKTTEPGLTAPSPNGPHAYLHTHSPFPPTPTPNTHPPQAVPEVAISGPKDFAKMAFLLQHGQKEQPGSGGSGGSTPQRGLGSGRLHNRWERVTQLSRPRRPAARLPPA